MDVQRNREKQGGHGAPLGKPLHGRSRGQTWKRKGHPAVAHSQAACPLERPRQVALGLMQRRLPVAARRALGGSGPAAWASASTQLSKPWASSPEVTPGQLSAAKPRRLRPEVALTRSGLQSGRAPAMGNSGPYPRAAPSGAGSLRSAGKKSQCFLGPVCGHEAWSCRRRLHPPLPGCSAPARRA